MPLTRHTRVSLGPIGLMVVGPIWVAIWVLVLATWLLAQAGIGIYHLACMISENRRTKRDHALQ